MRMHSNMGMRAISRMLNVLQGTIFLWVKHYGRHRYENIVKLQRLRIRSRENTKVVD
ncbi:hypothetical protein [Metallosphaera hakonensis]|uniref:hypothetical protein n=1 Tax=Metallosphaera hakonensis TaxID=79601 RepID=UPI001442FDCC|nr:hypothetical protein [Metallosphaera hakonensis]